MDRKPQKVTLVVGLELIIALVFILGARWTNTQVFILYQSYFADIFIPFGFYFLLSLAEYRHPIFKKWWVKASSVFALCAASEVLQFFGIFALARVFDPIDFVMYGVGVLLAAVVDRQIFAKYLSLWR